MVKLVVLEYPDKRLRNKAQPVAAVDDTIRRLVDDMFETMYAEEAVGLAATQVNRSERIIVMDISRDQSEPLALVNPEIISQSGIQYETEGCISFPTAYDRVERAALLRVRALDQHGKTVEYDAEGVFAVCIQHEIDHLNGVLFIDHLSRLKQTRLIKKLEKSRKQTVTD